LLPSRIDKEIASCGGQAGSKYGIGGIVMSLINYGVKMQAAAFQLQLAFDANDNASMQDALRRMEAIERAHMRHKALTNHIGRPSTNSAM
jgi:hypothetical protein